MCLYVILRCLYVPLCYIEVPLCAFMWTKHRFVDARNASSRNSPTTVSGPVLDHFNYEGEEPSCTVSKTNYPQLT